MMLGGKVRDEHLRRMESGKHCDEHEIKQIFSDYCRETSVVETLVLLLEDFLKIPNPDTSGASTTFPMNTQKQVLGSAPEGLETNEKEMLASTKDISETCGPREFMDALADSNGSRNENDKARKQKRKQEAPPPPVPRSNSIPFNTPGQRNSSSSGYLTGSDTYR